MTDKATSDKQIMYRDARTTGKYDDIWQSTGKCVFCDLRDKYVIYEENGVVLTIVLFAYIDGHCMIIPRRHVRSVKELTPVEWETIALFGIGLYIYAGEDLPTEDPTDPTLLQQLLERIAGSMNLNELKVEYINACKLAGSDALALKSLELAKDKRKMEVGA